MVFVQNNKQEILNPTRSEKYFKRHCAAIGIWLKGAKKDRELPSRC